MELLELILINQIIFAAIDLIIQFYAMFSVRWALFHSRAELGLIEEHGHYGLWSMCVYRKLIPAQIDDDGQPIIDEDCDLMNTFFTPGHPRAFISFFVIIHTIFLMVFGILVLLRILEIHYEKWHRNRSKDSEMNLEIRDKRWIIIAGRLLFNINEFRNNHENYLRNLIRKKLYVISVAVLSTMMALAGALTPRQSLRSTDVLYRFNVADSNYQIWHGPGFWAQMTAMIMDMLMTILIVFEVRVLFATLNRTSSTLAKPEVQAKSYSPRASSSIIDSSSNDDNEERINENQTDRSIYQSISKTREQSIDLEMKSSKRSTHGKLNSNERSFNPLSSSSSSSSASSSLRQKNAPTVSYVDSEHVRRLKNQSKQESTISKPQSFYANPIFNEN
ncbi:hypothetical protein NH340_JMT02060 [Sarcoptes scabiei]|nr:hypothetical protein NH340_JMT02060 [Sarcoptes scabiei]